MAPYPIHYRKACGPVFTCASKRLVSPKGSRGNRDGTEEGAAFLPGSREAPVRSGDVSRARVGLFEACAGSTLGKRWDRVAGVPEGRWERAADASGCGGPVT